MPKPKTTLFRTFSRKIIRSSSDYWTMHFAAVISCLHEHLGLRDRAPQSLGLDWTLESWKGSQSNDTFGQIKGQLYNWGAQYVLADSFNKDHGGFRDEFMDLLQARLGFSLKADKAECVVSGRDSACSQRFLSECNARIAGDRRRRVQPSLKSVIETDLCIVAPTSNRLADNVAIFGEVEGQYGNKLLQPDYWVRKSVFAQFGIGRGNSEGSESVIVRDVELEDRSVTVILFESKDNLLSDFHDAIEDVSLLLHRGPREKFWRAYSAGVGRREALDLLAEHWKTPVIELLMSLGLSPTRGKSLVTLADSPTRDTGFHQAIIYAPVAIGGSDRRRN